MPAATPTSRGLGGAELAAASPDQLQLPSLIFRMAGVDRSELNGFARLRLSLAIAGAVRSQELPDGCESVLVRPGAAVGRGLRDAERAETRGRRLRSARPRAARRARAASARERAGRRRFPAAHPAGVRRQPGRRLAAPDRRARNAAPDRERRALARRRPHRTRARGRGRGLDLADRALARPSARAVRVPCAAPARSRWERW